MLVAIDVETTPIKEGVKPEFVLGVVKPEKGKAKVFYTGSAMWSYILFLGKKCAKAKKTLTVYAHNHTFDFLQYADLTDNHISYFCFNPFIASYKYSFDELAKIGRKPKNDIPNYSKDVIKFLDSFALFRMSLERLGDMLKMPKSKMPNYIVEKRSPEFYE